MNTWTTGLCLKYVRETVSHLCNNRLIYAAKWAEENYMKLNKEILRY